MLTEKQLNIFEVLAKKPFAEHTRQQIKKESKEKSNNTLALVINRLQNEDIITEKKIGRSGILMLNLMNSRTFYYIALCNDKRMNKLARIAVNAIKKEMTNTPFYAMAIFGSYAINQQKQTSDIDIAVFIENEENKKKIEASMNSAKLKIPVQADIQVIPQAEIIEMLANKEENLGKQIARKHIAVHNHQIFYEIVKEGMNHGFRI